MNAFESLEFAENADQRAALVLVLDVSTSMGEPLVAGEKSPLEALNDGLDVLVTALNRDALAKRRVEVSIISYGSEVSEPTPFATVDNIILPTLVASGLTSTGAALLKALDAVEERKQTYRNNGIQYTRPWIMLISDGLATDDLTEAKARLREAEETKKALFFPIGVEGADLDELSTLSGRTALPLSGTKFEELFEWVSASQSAVSASQPGDGGVKLPSPAGWAEIDV